MKELKLMLTPVEKLYHWRRKNRLTQGQLAEKVKVHQTTISKMEKGLIPISERVLGLISNVKVDDGSRMVLLRRRLKLTLRDITDETGLHQHRLSEMERGLREVDPVYTALILKKLDA